MVAAHLGILPLALLEQPILVGRVVAEVAVAVALEITLVAMEALELSLLLIKGHKEAQAELLFPQMVTPTTHLLHQALTQHKGKTHDYSRIPKIYV